MKYIKPLNKYSINENVLNSLQNRINEVNDIICDHFDIIRVNHGKVTYEVINGFVSIIDGKYQGFMNMDDYLVKNREYCLAYIIRINFVGFEGVGEQSEIIIKNINNISKLCNTVKECINYLKRDLSPSKIDSTLSVDDIIRLDKESFEDTSGFYIRISLCDDYILSMEEINEHNEKVD